METLKRTAYMSKNIQYIVGGQTRYYPARSDKHRDELIQKIIKKGEKPWVRKVVD